MSRFNEIRPTCRLCKNTTRIQNVSIDKNGNTIRVEDPCPLCGTPSPPRRRDLEGLSAEDNSHLDPQGDRSDGGTDIILESCPVCNGKVQFIGGNAAFCLNCSWDNLSELSPKTRPYRETSYYRLENGLPVPESDLSRWGEWFERSDDRIVEQTQIRYEDVEVQISTVFLGIDHGLDRGLPLLFETMVFGGALDGERAQYATILEAQAGHWEVVEDVKRTRGATG